ncbi:replication terminator protein [Sporosarcina sp. FSL W7-1283]|uniref:replication terminator protein n=1 Tax=Sporosarcina sp. FSL W7-1283 TaxID=2921560 RepID=UPI0030F93605
MENNIELNKFIGGAVQEKFNVELQRVLDNIADPNTDFKKARKVTLTVSLKPNEKRNLADIKVETKSTIAPPEPIGTEILIGMSNDGKVVGKELMSGVEGQSYFDDKGDVRDDVGEKIEEEPKSKASDKKVVNFK